MPRPKRDMKRVNVYIPEKYYRALHLIANARSSTSAEIMREAIREYLANRAQEMRTQKLLDEEARLREAALLARENNSAIT